MITTAPAPHLIDNRAFHRTLVLALLGVLGGILLSRHAVTRHGGEARAIRECLDRDGPLMQYQDRDRDDIRFLVCELEPEPCPKWAVMIAQVWPSLVDDCAFRERSSFVPRDGSPDRVTEYLEKYAEVIE